MYSVKDSAGLFQVGATHRTRGSIFYSRPFEGKPRWDTQQGDVWARSTAFLAVPLPVNPYGDAAGREPQRPGIDPAVCVLSWGFRWGMAVRNLRNYQRPLHILVVLPGTGKAALGAIKAAVGSRASVVGKTLENEAALGSPLSAFPNTYHRGTETQRGLGNQVAGRTLADKHARCGAGWPNRGMRSGCFVLRTSSAIQDRKPQP